MARSAQDIARAEVIYCVSGLVSTLAGASFRFSAHDDARHDQDQRAHIELCDQAVELSAPVADYESAARDAGWEEMPGKPGGQHVFRDETDGQTWCAKDWQDLCTDHDIEPYDRDVYEHWIVSDWLADKLEAKGEKVDRDFAGMTIWARTTTGQAIAIDAIIVEIAADLAREYPE